MKAKIKFNNITLEVTGTTPKEISTLLSSLSKSNIDTEETEEFPKTLEESIQAAKAAGYPSVTAKNFSSANRVVQTIPRFVSSLGSCHNFVSWYRHLDNTEARVFNYNTTDVKTVSLVRYFDMASRS